MREKKRREKGKYNIAKRVESYVKMSGKTRNYANRTQVTVLTIL